MKQYETIELVQQSPEWLEFRNMHIGASDASVIRLVNQFKTPYQLWKEKLGIISPDPMNAAMQRGVDLEPVARERFIEETGIDMVPSVVRSLEREWMIASLDGINEVEQCLLEIKCPGKKTCELARKGQIPEYYNVQIQHQLSVTGFSLAYYYCFDGDVGYKIIVKREDELIDKLIRDEKEFYDSLVSMEPLNEWVEIRGLFVIQIK